MNKILKFISLFLIGGSIYFLMETIWRGYSHWSMFILGGICFVIVGGLNEYYGWDMPFWKQCLIGAAVITGLEFLTGLIVNKMCGWTVWDYSGLPLNIMGQICLPYSLLWFVLSGVAIVIDDYLRYWLFGEEKPHYNFKIKG
jgi:uncharacterized membrane protein